MNDELLGFIKSLQSEKKHDSIGEEATKMKFILNALSHLGWNPFNLDEVYPEQDVGGGKVDYALRHKNKNKVFIEAKKVGEPLEKHQEQLLNYSFKFGVKISILTNGITWWFYLPLHEGDWEQRRFYTIEIYDQDAEDITNKFIDFLSKENVISGKAITNSESIYKSKQRDDLIKGTLPKAWVKLVKEPDELLVDLISETTEKLCGFKPEDKEVKKFISRELIKKIDISKPEPAKISPVKPILVKPEPAKSIGLKKKYSGKAIQSFTLKGNKYEVKSWIELLRMICKNMATNHKDNFELVLKLTGRKRPYFSKQSNEIRKPKKIEGTDIYFETNLSATMIVRISQRVISLFGYKPEDLSIETE